MLTMGIMSAAVGSDCVGCHPSAGTDQVDWALDTPRKRTARRMVQMVTDDQPRQLQRTPGGDLLDLPSRPRQAGDHADAGRRLRRADRSNSTTCSPRLRRAIRRSGAGQVPAGDRRRAERGAHDELRRHRQERRLSRLRRRRRRRGLGAGAGQARRPTSRFPEYPDRGVSVRTYDGRTGWIATPLAVVPEVRAWRQRARRREAGRACCRSRRRSRQRSPTLRVGLPTTIEDKDVTVVQGNGPNGTLATLYFDDDVRPARADGASWPLADRPRADAGGLLRLPRCRRHQVPVSTGRSRGWTAATTSSSAT